MAKLLPPVCAAASMLRWVFPVDTSEMWVELEENGLPAAFHIRALGHAMPDVDAWHCYETLIWKHLLPLGEALHHQCRLPLKIFWGNAARSLENIVEAARPFLPNGSPLLVDLQQLLEIRIWPAEISAPDISMTSPRANPLFGPVKTVTINQDGTLVTQRLLRQCCLLYKISPEESYCGACPLDPRYRPHKQNRPDILTTD